MSRVANDPDKEEILKKLTELLKKINEEMLYAPKGQKLPNLIELGKRLAEIFNRTRPFSNHAISEYMKLCGYKPNHKTKQYEKEKTFTINGYVGEPSLVYIPISYETDIKKIRTWAKQNFPQTFEDTITTDNGIIVIGNTDKFANKFIKRYDEYAKENHVKLKTSNLDEEPSP